MAVWESITSRAAPLKTVRCTRRGPDWSAIEECIAQWQPDVLVVGLPLSAEGVDQAMTAPARHFARQLEKRFGLPVETVDETLSSVEAEALLREQRRRGVRRKRVRKADVDQQAAQIILHRWYDLRGSGSEH